MTEAEWEVDAKLIRGPDGEINLILNHEKGRSVLVLISGKFYFSDKASLGALADLLS